MHTNVFSRHILKLVPPATISMSLKNGERFMATIGPSNIAEYHSAFDALIRNNNYSKFNVENF